MKSFLTIPGLLLSLFIGQLANKTQSSLSPSVTKQNISYKQYVFAIDIWNREKQEDVQNPANWRFLGEKGDIPRCGPGNLQACQLVVDERDTWLPKEGEPRLTPCVKISALLNEKAKVWFVKSYTSSGLYTYEILNEQDEKKQTISLLIVFTK